MKNWNIYAIYKNEADHFWNTAVRSKSAETVLKKFPVNSRGGKKLTSLPREVNPGKGLN